MAKGFATGGFKAGPYITIGVVFICAWVNDAHPSLGAVMIAVAGLAIAVQVGASFFRARDHNHEGRLVAKLPEVESQKGRQVSSVEETAVGTLCGPIGHTASKQAYAKSLANHVRRIHASEVYAWSLGTSAHRTAAKFIERGGISPSLWEPCDLDNWAVLDFGNDVFNVDAGAFLIEHYRGKTVIRVRDASKVTVEDGDYELEEGLSWLRDERPSGIQRSLVANPAAFRFKVA